MNKNWASSPSNWETVYPELVIPDDVINPYELGTPFWALFRFGYRLAVRGKPYENPCVDKEYRDALKMGYNACK